MSRACSEQRIFQSLEDNKRRLGIAHFSVSQTSLEHVMDIITLRSGAAVASRLAQATVRVCVRTFRARASTRCGCCLPSRRRCCNPNPQAAAGKGACDLGGVGAARDVDRSGEAAVELSGHACIVNCSSIVRGWPTMRVLCGAALQETNCVVVDVPVDTEEWRSVAMRFHASLKATKYHAIRIERVQVRVCAGVHVIRHGFLALERVFGNLGSVLK